MKPNSKILCFLTAICVLLSPLGFPYRVHSEKIPPYNASWTVQVQNSTRYSDASDASLLFYPALLTVAQIHQPALNHTTITANDGWMLESDEQDNKSGPTLKIAAAFFSQGDDTANKEYRSVLHFDTSGLPDNAVIMSTILKIKQQRLVGTNPFRTHSALLLDMTSGVTLKAGWVKQSTYIAVAAENSASITVQFHNTGTASWVESDNVVYLANRWVESNGLYRLNFALAGTTRWVESSRLYTEDFPLAHNGELDNSNIPPSPPFEPLTPRENDVLLYVAFGRSNKQIAQKLKISSKTVEVYLYRITRKLRVPTRVGVAVMAVKLGLVNIQYEDLQVGAFEEL